MSLTPLTGPTATFLDVNEVKAHLRVDNNDEDTLIQALIDGVIGVLDGAQGFLGRALVSQSWTLKLDEWPCKSVVELPLAPLITVDAIRYLDTAGVQQTLASTKYQVKLNGAMPGNVRPAYSLTWPLLYCVPDAVEIDFTAGYGGPEKVPQGLLNDCLAAIQMCFDDRSVSVTKAVDEVGFAYHRILTL